MRTRSHGRNRICGCFLVTVRKLLWMRWPTEFVMGSAPEPGVGTPRPSSLSCRYRFFRECDGFIASGDPKKLRDESPNPKVRNFLTRSKARAQNVMGKPASKTAM